MKFLIKKVSDLDFEETKEINTIEELARFSQMNGGVVIIDMNIRDFMGKVREFPTITIWDQQE